MVHVYYKEYKNIYKELIFYKNKRPEKTEIEEKINKWILKRILKNI